MALTDIPDVPPRPKSIIKEIGLVGVWVPPRIVRKVQIKSARFLCPVYLGLDIAIVRRLLLPLVLVIFVTLQNTLLRPGFRFNCSINKMHLDYR